VRYPPFGAVYRSRYMIMNAMHKKQSAAQEGPPDFPRGGLQILRYGSVG
jgi:hypothetical protein